VVLWRGRKLVLEKEVGAPFGERRIETFEWWRKSCCPRRGGVGAPALHRLEILPIYISLSSCISTPHSIKS
jgi:hypothetical protein